MITSSSQTRILKKLLGRINRVVHFLPNQIPPLLIIILSVFVIKQFKKAEINTLQLKKTFINLQKVSRYLIWRTYATEPVLDRSASHSGLWQVFELICFWVGDLRQLESPWPGVWTNGNFIQLIVAEPQGLTDLHAWPVSG